MDQLTLALTTTEARFMVSPDRGEGAWVHPLEVPTQTPGWIDCTDMDDDEFVSFMRGETLQ